MRALGQWPRAALAGGDSVHRPLLKLDLEGHELAARRGAERSLAAVEVLVSEARLGGLVVAQRTSDLVADRSWA